MIGELVDRLQNGSIGALARLITLVENEHPEAMNALKRLYPQTGNAYIVGITGPPGSGKSTLTDKITRSLRSRGLSVGIIAIDPSSPFSGGALLGDRLRMMDMTNDEGVFFRSMATRGALGGLTKATSGVIALMDAFGKDYILLETVGVGQDELDIVKTADTTLLVSVPGLGDTVQVMKAGIMEIGDVYVVNKADNDGAESLVTELRLLRDLNTAEKTWIPPIVKTVATKNDGIDSLLENLLAHRKHLESNNELQPHREKRTVYEIKKMVEDKVSNLVGKTMRENLNVEHMIKEVSLRKRDPYGCVEEIVGPFETYLNRFRVL